MLLHILEALFTPPARYPDLFPVLNVLVSTPVFGLVWLWSVRRGVEAGWALGGLGSKSASTPKPAKIEANGYDDAATVGSAAGNATASNKQSIGREAGARAISLGYAQGRRRHGHRNDSISSVLSGVNRGEREQN